MSDTNHYVMEEKVNGETKQVSIQTKASNIILEDGTSLESRIEELTSKVNLILNVVIDDKLNKVTENLYTRIMNELNSSK